MKFNFHRRAEVHVFILSVSAPIQFAEIQKYSSVLTGSPGTNCFKSQEMLACSALDMEKQTTTILCLMSSFTIRADASPAGIVLLNKSHHFTSATLGQDNSINIKQSDDKKKVLSSIQKRCQSKTEWKVVINNLWSRSMYNPGEGLVVL